MFFKKTLEDDPGTFVAMLVVALLAIVLDQLWTRHRDRGDQIRAASGSAAGGPGASGSPAALR